MRRFALLASVAAVGASVVLTPGTASAVTPPITFTGDALPTWQTNGVVWAMAEANGLVFAGGTFSAIRPPGSAAGSNERTAANVAVFDAATGAPTSCTLSATIGSGSATVRALAVSPDQSTLYLGGNFASVNGVAASRLAAVDIASCSVRTTFRPPAISATVRAISATASTVYFGGDLTTVGGQTRGRYAAVSTTGALQPWAPNADLPGRALAILPTGDVAIGGDFDNVNGAASHALAVVNSSTGASVRTYPDNFISPTSVVKSIASDGTQFYTGNEGTGGGVFDGRIALSLSSYDQVWRDTCLGATQAVLPYEGVLYAASHVHDCSSMGLWPNTTRHHLSAELVSDPHLLPWFPDTNDGIGESIGPRVLSAAESGGKKYLWVGGEFTTVGGVPQQGLTRMADSPDTGAPSTPVVSAASVKAGQVQVRWQTSVDTDDGTLTYRVYRNGSATPIYTGTADSVWWNRPQAGFVDTSVTPGTTYTYRVTASDGPNTSALSSTVSVTAVAADAPYPSRVLNDGATTYWRYDEASGAFAADTSPGNNNGVYTGGPTYRVSPGAISGDSSTGIGLDGTDSYVYSGALAPSPSTYTIETWFKTTTTSGGKLVGFGNGNQSTSGSYDKHIYMLNDGRLTFGVYTGATVTVTSPSAYNDGNWHHVVASQGADGMRLYVDGAQVGSGSTTNNQSYSGYWRVGGDNLNGWPSPPSSYFFQGSIDETAIYPTVLTPSQVSLHFLSGNPAGDTTAPSAPSDLAATTSGNDVGLSWTASTDNVAVTGYQVHRSSTSGFTPSAATRVATVSGTTYTDPSVAAGTWYYRVVAVDGNGNVSPPSGQASVTLAAPPVVTTLTPTADTYANQGAPTTNYGTTNSVAVRGSAAYVGYLRFSLPAAPAGQVLKSATLRVRTTADSFAGSADPQTVTTVTAPWAETTLTYNNRPATTGTVLGTLTGANAISTAYDVTLSPEQVTSLLGGDATLAVTATGTDNFWFSSREAGTAAYRPQLTLTFGAP